MRFSSLVRLVRFVLPHALVVALATLLLVVSAPGCGRSSLESETLDSGVVTPPGSCNAETCPKGCCDGSGTCRVGTDTRACGQGGNRCSDCIANGFDTCGDSKTCNRNGCTNCNGCCDRNGGVEICRAGADATACGRSGADCVDCSEQGRACDPASGSCGTGQCDKTNCPGCCVGDKCLAGTDQTACGDFGQACDSCAARGQKCQPQSSGGGTCQGTPSCSPANCGGCCNGTTCTGGTDNNSCGKGGVTCQNCVSIGDVCVPNGQPNERTCQPATACGPANCPGCCLGNSCIIATTPAECGFGGQACKPCPPGDTCNAGLCQPSATCNPGNCLGCCVGNICATGNQDTACGVGGLNCQNCIGAGEVCTGGACSPPVCGPGNCAGCCSGNVCVIGTQDNACGLGGQACADCGAGNQICQGRVCKDKCGPANCAGCCSSGNACAPGFANNNCGANGDACQNCNALGSTCDNLVSPPVCTNQQNTCPATYGGCAAGVTTPVTTQNQGVCADIDLNGLSGACAGGADTVSCIGAFSALDAVNPACSACLKPFDVNFFPTAEGIFLCAAPFVSAACNHSSGCDFDCTTSSCSACVPANVDQCETQVQGGAGQCAALATQASCVTSVLGPGQPGRFCNPNIYPPLTAFGSWLQAVGKKFCGGP